MAHEIIRQILQNSESAADLKDDFSQLHEKIVQDREKARADIKDVQREELDSLKGKMKDVQKHLQEEGYKTLTAEQQYEHQEKLRALEKFFDEMEKDVPKPAIETPAEVSDIAEADPNTKKGIMDQMKGFMKGGGMAVLAPIIKGFIAIKRALLDWFPSKDPVAAKKQLDNIEQLYGRFFGASELQEMFNKYCKDNGVAMKAIEGTSDGMTYADLKVGYQDYLNARFTGKSEEQKAAILSAYTFEGFVQEQMKKYVDGQKERNNLKIGH